MNEALVGLVVFACLATAFLVVLRAHPRLPEPHRSAETLAVVRLGSGVVATLSALVIGLVLSTVASGLAQTTRDVRLFAGTIGQLDTVLRAIGPDGVDARALLLAYTERAISGTWHVSGQDIDDRDAASLLASTEAAVVAIPRANAREIHYADRAVALVAALADARQHLIADDARTVPTLFLVLLVFWLTILFASFGYCAPRNGTVIATILFVAAAVAAGIYLLVEMDGSFSGLVVVSSAPLERTLAALRGA